MDIRKTDYQQTIIDRVKSLRTENNITQLMMSKILGISPGQLGNIESVKFPHKYTLKQLVAFCEYIDYPITKLMSPNGEETTDANTLIHNIIDYEQ